MASALQNLSTTPVINGVVFRPSMFQASKLPKDNITKEQRLAVKEMRGWKDEVILPADKGNATVVMSVMTPFMCRGPTSTYVTTFTMGAMNFL